MARRCASFGFVALTLLGLAACTETDDVVRDLGALRLFLIDAEGLDPQVNDDDPSAATWGVEPPPRGGVLEAEMTIEGETVDLTGGEACRFDQTVQLSPLASGKCASGILMAARDEVVPVTLTLKTTMRVRRGNPLNLPTMMADYDGDMFDNDMDNCPAASNPGQEDIIPMNGVCSISTMTMCASDSDCPTGEVCFGTCSISMMTTCTSDNDCPVGETCGFGDGVGDACQVVDPMTGLVEPDTDGDGVVDGVDRCLGVADPAQVDMDGNNISDICETTIEMNNDPVLQFNFPAVDILPQAAQTSFLVVDFRGVSAITPACDWNDSSCPLDPAKVKLCFAEDTAAAVMGCP